MQNIKVFLPRTNIGCIALKRKRVLLSLLAILKDVIQCCEKQNRWLNDKAIIELGFLSVNLSVSRRSIICLCLRHRQIIDLLTTDKSRYFAQPRPILASYCLTKANAKLIILNATTLTSVYYRYYKTRRFNTATVTTVLQSPKREDVSASSQAPFYFPRNYIGEMTGNVVYDAVR